MVRGVQLGRLLAERWRAGKTVARRCTCRDAGTNGHAPPSTWCT